MKSRQKTAKADYTPNMLPANRRAVFFDVVKLQWQKLLLLGLILLLFYTPVLLSVAAKDIYISNLSQTLEGAEDAQKLGAGQMLVYLDILRNGVHILFMLLFATGLSGVCRVLRQFAWGENVHMPTDLPKGIRDNYKQTAGLLVLSGILYTLCLTVYYTASSYNSSLMTMLSLLPVTISLLLILPIAALTLSMIPVYSNKLTKSFKNAFFIYSRCLPKTLLVLGCCLLLWAPSLISNFYCHILGSVFAILLTPFALLAWNLYCYDLFDIHINATLCPELIGKGTFPSAED